jgi:hypothetical protein
MDNAEQQKALKAALRMSQEQLTYISCKAIYDTVYPKYIKDVQPAYETEGKEEQLQALCAVDEKYNWSAISDNLMEAEKKLIQWGENVIKEKFPDRYHEVKPVFDRYMFHPDIREQLIKVNLSLVVK